MTLQANEASPHENPFVTRLIRLQQDGKEAISGPANWREPPFLDVATDTDDAIDALLKAMCPSSGGSRRRGRWHWLIGSPGNGKSAKLGLLARRLLARGYKIDCEDGTAIGNSDPDWLPYLLEVREEGRPYRFAYLVQDASVVKEPFGVDCDPARDLAGVLRQAFARGVSLLLCTNWGVLQRLFERVHTDPVAREEPWFRAVKGAIQKSDDGVTIRTAGGTSGERTVFDELDVKYEFLDNRSLLVNNDVFDRLVRKATDKGNWHACSGCPSRSLCPFHANRDDLASESLRRSVLDILRRAEVLGGQIIVFREAVALVSLLLAGCPGEHGDGTPCEWVHDQVRGNRYFSLLGRRLPSVLFGAARAHGLEGPERHSPRAAAIRRVQLSALDASGTLLHGTSTVRHALAGVTAGGLSEDVGVERLLGANGAVPALDPSLDPRHVVELDEFVAVVTSSRPADIAGHESSTPGLRAIEEHCLRAWDEILDAIAAAGDPVTGQDLHFWIRRWQTTCLTWIAAVTRGLTALQPELDDYLGFLRTSGEGAEKLTTVRDLEEDLEGLLSPRELSGNGALRVRLAPSLLLTGRWTDSELRPRLDEGAADSNAILVKMGRVHPFVVTAETFTWLSRHRKLNLSELSFNPDVLESLRRTQAQAAAASKYSVQDDDISIVIVDEMNVEHTFERRRGFLLGKERP